MNLDGISLGQETRGRGLLFGCMSPKISYTPWRMDPIRSGLLNDRDDALDKRRCVGLKHLVNFTVDISVGANGLRSL